MIEWSLLSAETVKLDGTSLALANRARHVLLRLLLDANHTVTTDQLADALWGDDLPKSARNSLARFVGGLRADLGPYRGRLETATGGYRLVVHDGERDIDRIAVTLAQTQTTSNPDNGVWTVETTEQLRVHLTQAGLSPNPYLEELFEHEAIARGHNELRIGLIESLADSLYHQGLHTELIALLEQVVDDHPFHERFWFLLVASLDATGRSRQALRVCERLNDLLAEIGVTASEPNRQIQVDIASRISGNVPASGAPHAPSLESPAAVSITQAIPNPGTSLIGRVEDLRAAHTALSKHKSVTVVALGGSGKTRLALGLVDVLSSADAPVHQLSLRSVLDAHVVLPLVAATLGIPSTREIDAVTLAKRVALQDFVLILDNCEHVKDTCAELMVALKNHAPGASVLATSREALDFPGEVTYLLAPLSTVENTAHNRSRAAELFIERAGSQLGSEPNADEVERVEQVCRQLNGLPLAIEIAAAQLAFMSLAELDKRISEAFAIDRTIVEPAVTAVTEVLDWAWNNLSPSQQSLLARLSVFASGWTMAAATAVRAGPGAITADLDRLVATALVVAPDNTGRYSMLAPVREYAATRLQDRAETTIMRDRLVTWALDLTNSWSFPEHHLWCGPNDELQPEHGNLIAALTHLREVKRHQDLVILAVASSGMMVNRGLAADLIRWLSPHLDDESVDRSTRGSAHAALGTAAHAVGDLEGLSEIGVRALALADGQPLDWVPIVSGYMSVWSLVAPSDMGTDELSALSFETAGQSNSRRLNMAVASLYRAHVEFVARNYVEALRLFREANSLVVHPGRGLLVIEIGMTLSLYMLGRHDDARESIDTWRSRSDSDHWHYILEINRAIVVGGTGDPERATAELAATVRALPEAEAWGRAGVVQTAFAMLADFRGEFDLATELFASAINRDILLLTVSISHVMDTRNLSGDEAWLELGIEFWTRIVPPGSVAATATSTPQLLRWWASGAIDGPALVT